MAGKAWQMEGLCQQLLLMWQQTKTQDMVIALKPALSDCPLPADVCLLKNRTISWRTSVQPYEPVGAISDSNCDMVVGCTLPTDSYICVLSSPVIVRREKWI